MKVAIIGLGNIGARLATTLVAGGQSMIISERNLAKSEALAAKLGPKAQAMPLDEAAKAADVVILAISFAAIKDFVAAHRSALSGKIVVDPSNPIAPDGTGGFKKTIPADRSAGMIIAGLLPEGPNWSRPSALWALNRWAPARIASPSPPCFSMRRTTRKPAGRWPSSSAPAALRRSASAASINPSTSRSVATFTNSASWAGW
jgi:NADP oxidoreductase coenzyme F420-dependent